MCNSMLYIALCYRLILSLFTALWISMSSSSLFCSAFLTCSLTSLKPAARLLRAWSLLEASLGLEVAKTTSLTSSASWQLRTEDQREESRSISSPRRFLSRHTGATGRLVSQRIKKGSQTDPERPKSANLKAVLWIPTINVVESKLFIMDSASDFRKVSVTFLDPDYIKYSFSNLTFCTKSSLFNDRRSTVAKNVVRNRIWNAFWLRFREGKKLRFRPDPGPKTMPRIQAICWPIETHWSTTFVEFSISLRVKDRIRGLHSDKRIRWSRPETGTLAKKTYK